MRWALALALVLSIAGTASAAELIVNGDFEWGNLTGWTIYGSPDVPIINNTEHHGGSYSGLIRDSYRQGGIEQYIDLTGVTNISYWTYHYGSGMVLKVDSDTVYTEGSDGSTGWIWRNISISYTGSHWVNWTGNQDNNWWVDDISVTSSGGGSDTTPPQSLSAFANTTTCSQTNISFTKPSDSDYNGFKVWWNDAAETNQTNTSTWYNKSGLSEVTSYTLSTKTFDLVGNLNATFTNYTITTGDCTPPLSITGLTGSAYATNATWDWANPSDADFSYTHILLNNVFLSNVTSPTDTKTAIGLYPKTGYTLSTRTVDTSGNMNATWVNSTVNTTEVVVLVGDSIMHINDTMHEIDEYILDDQPTWDVYNTGEGGRKTADMVSNFSEVTDLNGTIVIYECGINDISGGRTSDAIITDILAYETEAQANNVTLYLNTIEPTGLLDVDKRPVLDAVNNWIRCNFTQNHGNRYYIDLFEIIEDPADPYHILPAYTYDGQHLTNAGFQAWGEAIDTSWPSTSPSCADTTPPTSITALTNTSVSCSQLFFNWSNPLDSDYDGLMVWRNNTALANLTNTTTGVSWTGLPESTDITFSGKTFDLVGNVNASFVNMTRTTGACGVAPTAAFAADDTTVCTTDTVTFTDASTDSPTSWNWSFGDGNVSALQNPTKIFNITGTYTINLTVNNTYGADSEVKTNYIVVSECAVPPTVSLDSDFTSNVTCGNVPFYVMFNDTSAGTEITTWNWSFGEGNYSDLEDDINLYSTPGLYTVRHSVADGLGNVSWENRTGAIRAVPDWITCAAATGTAGGGSGSGSEGISILFGVVGGILGTIIIMRREKT
jgi:PKD repeat protein